MIVEFVAGKVTDSLLKMIALYRPDCESPSTHTFNNQPWLSEPKESAAGFRSGARRWVVSFAGIARDEADVAAPGMGSVSRFAVSHSPVPVIVVR